MGKDEDKVKELKALIEKLEGDKNRIIDWTSLEVKAKELKVLDLQRQADAFNQSMVKSRNDLDIKSKELISQQEEIKKLKVENEKARQAAQFELTKVQSSLSNLNFKEANLADKEKQINYRENAISAREAKVDTAMSYITSIFQSIEKLKVS